MAASSLKTALSRVRGWHAHPKLATEAEAAEWLVESSFGPGHAVAFEGRVLTALEGSVFAGLKPNQRTVVTARGVSVLVVELTGIDPQFFCSNVALGDAVDGIGERISAERLLAPFHGPSWDVEVVNPGATFTTSLVEGGVCCFVSTKKSGGDYFDFVAYEGERSATYSQRRGVAGMRHSGDIGSLLHTLRAKHTMPEGQPVALAVVGYCRRRLRLFSDQLPAVCVPSVSERVVRIVPCPLDEASVGNNTMACLMTVERVGSELRWSVMSAVPGAEGVNTGEVSAETRRCVAEAIRDAAISQAAPPPPPLPVVDSPTGGSVTARYDLVVAVEHGLAATFIPGDAELVACFGAGLDIVGPGSVKRGAALDTVVQTSGPVLPLAAGGALSGPAAVAVVRQSNARVREGAPAAVAWDAYAAALASGCLRVVHCTERMVEQLSNACETKLNAIFIVHADDKRNAAAPTIPGQTQLEARLADVNVAAVAAMAGPLSIVAVELADGRRYFYRGVRWMGLLERVPAFGDDVTELLGDARLRTVAAAGTCRVPSAPFVARDSLAVEFRGAFLPAASVVEMIAAMPVAELAAARPEVERVLAQMQVVLTPSQLEAHVRRLVERVSQLVEDTVGAAQRRFTTARKTSAVEVEVLVRSGRELSEAKRKLQWLVDALGTCLSVKGTASRRHELNRLKRKAVISGNVEAAKRMTQSNVEALLEEACDEDAGCLVAHIDGAKLVQTLHAISPAMNKLTYCAQQRTVPRAVSIHDRLPRVDSLTAAALLEIAAQEGSPTTLLSAKAGSQSPSLAMVGLSGQAALPIPLLRRFVQLRDPSAVQWLEEANTSTVARVRILLRGTLSESRATQNHTVPPMARDLGYALIDVVLQAVEAFVRKATPAATAAQAPAEPVGHGSFDDSLCQTVRGGLGLVFSTMASNANPLSSAWQVVQGRLAGPPVVPREPKLLWLYARVAALYPLSAWPAQPFTANLQTIAAGILDTFVVRPIILGTSPSVGMLVAARPPPPSSSLQLSGAPPAVAQALSQLRCDGDEGPDGAAELVAAAVGSAECSADEVLLLWTRAAAGRAPLPLLRRVLVAMLSSWKGTAAERTGWALLHLQAPSGEILSSPSPLLREAPGPVPEPPRGPGLLKGRTCADTDLALADALRQEEWAEAGTVASGGKRRRR